MYRPVVKDAGMVLLLAPTSWILTELEHFLTTSAVHLFEPQVASVHAGSW